MNTVTIGNLEWSHTLLDGARVDYEEAEKAVTALGPGWRLPTRQELESLLDLSRHDPAIDTRKFPDTRSGAYWSNTPCAWSAAVMWVVYFGSGGVVGDGHRYYFAYVRAVRDGQ